MKKIDLHLHTISTVSDHSFEFSMDSLIKYIAEENLDAIAITNHNRFDRNQYEDILKATSIPVFPGIEVDIEGGHLLVLTELNDLTDFSDKCNQVFTINGSSNTSFLTEEQFLRIFGDGKEYLMIPHYDKSPKLNLSKVPNIRENISCGEVTSAKKFLSMKKNQDELVPVLFGDIRVSDPIHEKTNRQTYIDVDEISLSSIKYALMDSTKVSLSSVDGHTLFEVLDNGLCISTGLTVVLGKRSSGKSYTLDRIFEQFPHAKYIKQFSLLSTDEEKNKKEFENMLRVRGDSISERFLMPLKNVVDDVSSINLHNDETEIEEYLNALKKAASEFERQDIFAKCRLYQETHFGIKDLTSLDNLIDAVDILLNNIEYKELVELHIQRNNLLKLGVELRKQYLKEYQNNRQKQYVNDIIASTQNELRVRSTNTPIPEIDFYQILLNKYKVEQFIEVVKLIKQKRIIEERNLYSYRVVARSLPYNGASELQRISRSRTVFSDAYKQYDNPYRFLQLLKRKEELPSSEYYKYFVKINYEVLNQFGTPASGGERSEYNLLQELIDASRCEILILDEPESSFDNLFLKDGVNNLLKEVSKQIPVIIATHNNTIGASVHPDYLIYTFKEITEDGTPKYHLYSGNPSSKELKDLDGATISRREVVLDCLEAGEPAYIERRTSYEIFNN